MNKVIQVVFFIAFGCTMTACTTHSHNPSNKAVNISEYPEIADIVIWEAKDLSYFDPETKFEIITNSNGAKVYRITSTPNSEIVYRHKSKTKETDLEATGCLIKRPHSDVMEPYCDFIGSIYYYPFNAENSGYFQPTSQNGKINKVSNQTLHFTVNNARF